MAERVGLRARLVAASLEINHLRAMATNPDTLAELADTQSLIDSAAAHLSDEVAPEVAANIDVALTLARHRLRAIHNALAAHGRHAVVKPRG
jgi:ElaB/YqjD/DUF883 family membrane-anchored ribosome-binding protein